jgi:hypothetical protein
MATEEDDAALIEQLIDEALDGFRDLLPEEELSATRAILRDELRRYPGGVTQLRSALAHETGPEEPTARNDERRITTNGRPSKGTA